MKVWTFYSVLLSYSYLKTHILLSFCKDVQSKYNRRILLFPARSSQAIMGMGDKGASHKSYE